FVVAGFPRWHADLYGLATWVGTGAEFSFWPSLLEATALMFVAYTGYGRIATLGEEVREPARTIPRAIVLALAVSAALYVAVAFVAVSALGSWELAIAAEAGGAPLEAAAAQFRRPWVRPVVAAGAL